MPADTAPTGRDLDAALARMMGWAPDLIWCSHPTWPGQHCISDEVPSYSSSLDALARDVEPEIRRRGLEGAYVEELWALLHLKQTPVYFLMITAPASVRAAAAWKVLSEARTEGEGMDERYQTG